MVMVLVQWHRLDPHTMLRIVWTLSHLSVKSTYAFQLKLPCTDLVPETQLECAACVALATMLSTLRCSLFFSKPRRICLITNL